VGFALEDKQLVCAS